MKSYANNVSGVETHSSSSHTDTGVVAGTYTTPLSVAINSAGHITAAYDEWQSTITYEEGAVVRGSNCLLYKSLVAANLNQNPTTDSDLSHWSLFANADVSLMGSILGVIPVQDNIARIQIPRVMNITSVAGKVRTAPTGSTQIFDFKKNGTSIFGSAGDRLTFAISGTTGTAGTPSVGTVLAAGDILSVECTQAGSTVNAADLTFVVGVV